MAESRSLAVLLAVLTAISSVLPWFLTDLVFQELPADRFIAFVQMLIFPILWLIIATLTAWYSRWERRLFWLFALSPIAFAGPLFVLVLGLTFKAS